MHTSFGEDDTDLTENEIMKVRCALMSEFMRQEGNTHSERAKESAAFTKTRYHHQRLADLSYDMSEQYALLSAVYQGLEKEEKKV